VASAFSICKLYKTLAGCIVKFQFIACFADSIIEGMEITIFTSAQGYSVHKINKFHSHYLQREVEIDIFLPLSYTQTNRTYPFLLLNDGQDSEAVGLKNTLDSLTQTNGIPEIIVVGLYANAYRIQEYGIAAQADYKNRGSRAGSYTSFVIQELMVYLSQNYRMDTQAPSNTIAGYSLGGLSAFDIAWNYPEVFRKVGVFSGSFWWRQKAYEEGYVDNDRILHTQIRNSLHKPDLRFWLQAGTLDETADRNQNGIIDSIDDTLDIIVELTRKGYRPWDDIHYYQMEGGQHNPNTWGQAMPVFLQWAFGKRQGGF
jgi:enterochelin esterase-like enzyme